MLRMLHIIAIQRQGGIGFRYDNEEDVATPELRSTSERLVSTGHNGKSLLGSAHGFHA
jgi:hypothetical protein